MSFVVDSKGGCFLCLRECGSRRSGGGGGGDSTSTTILSLKLLTRVLGLDIRAVLKSSIDPLYLSQSIRNGEIGVRACGVCSELTRAFSELVAQLERVRLEVAASVARIEGVMLGSDRDSQLVLEYHRRVVSNSASPQDIIVSNMCEKLRKEVVLKCSKFSKGTFPRVELQRLDDDGSSSTTGGDLHHHHPSVQSQPPPLHATLYNIGIGVIDKSSTSTTSNNADKSGGGASTGGPSRMIKCGYCPLTFRTHFKHTEHEQWAHRSSFFASVKDPRLSSAQFEQVVADLFSGIIPLVSKAHPTDRRPTYKCAFCADVRHCGKGRLVFHYFRDHMGRLVSRFKKLQARMIARRSASGQQVSLPPVTLDVEEVEEEEGGANISETETHDDGLAIAENEDEEEEEIIVEKVIPRETAISSAPTTIAAVIPPCSSSLLNSSETRAARKGSFICTFCPQVFDTPDGIRAHIYVAHKTQVLLAHKEPGTSVELFERLVEELFAGISLPREPDGSYACAFCDKMRQGSLSQVYSHLIPSHMEELACRLRSLQEDPLAPLPPPPTPKASLVLLSHNTAVEREQRPFACPLCKKGIAFSTSVALEHHNLLEHRSAYFVEWQDPRLSAEQFESAVRSLFVGLIPKRVNNTFSCALCEGHRMGQHRRKWRLVAHVIRDHMEQLRPKLEELQEQLAVAAAARPSSPSSEAELSSSSSSSSGLSDSDKPVVKCALCTKSVRSGVHLEDHTFSNHRSSLFIQHKDGRLSSAQFERVLQKLFDGLALPQSAPPERRRRRMHACPFCSGSGVFRHKRKVRVYSHIVREHMNFLVPTLAGLQSEVADEETKAELEARTARRLKILQEPYPCRICEEKGYASKVHLENHKLMEHRGSYFTEFKDPRLSEGQFETVVRRLFVGLLPKKGANDWGYRCTLCDDDGQQQQQGQHSKARLVWHYILEHMEQLVPKLEELQEKEVVASPSAPNIDEPVAVAAAAAPPPPPLPSVVGSSTEHNVRFTRLKSGNKLKCSLCSKKISRNEWSKASHILSHTGGRPYPCNLCEDRAFRVAASLQDHNLMEHRSAYFAQWQDSRLTAEQFESAVESLFDDLIPRRLNGIFRCALCEDSRLGQPSKRAKLVRHYIRDHMGQLLPKLEELQEGLVAMAATSSSGAELGSRKLSQSQRRASAKLYKFKCDLCTRSFRYGTHLEEHTVAHHRSSLFSQHKEQRLSSKQFEGVLQKLFFGLQALPQSSSPPAGRHGCPFCDKFSHTRKGRVYCHMVREHMGLLVQTLAELQTEVVVVAAEGLGGEQKLHYGAAAASAVDDDPLETKKIGFAKLSNGKYRCRLCSKTVPAHDKNRHRLSHETPFKCDHCPKSFQTGATLEHHVYRSHLCSHFAQHKDPKLGWTDFKVLVAQLLSSVTVEDSATNSSSCSFCSDLEGSSRHMVHRHMLKEHMSQLVPLLTERQEESLTLLATTGGPFRDMRPRRLMRLHPYDRERPVTTERAMEDAVELVAGGGGAGGGFQQGNETSVFKKQACRTRELEMEETGGPTTTVVSAGESSVVPASMLPVRSQDEEMEVEGLAMIRNQSGHHHHQLGEGMKVEEEEGEEEEMEEEPSASTLLDDINSILGI